jgi:hypothetical protein
VVTILVEEVNAECAQLRRGMKDTSVKLAAQDYGQQHDRAVRGTEIQGELLFDLK